MISAMLDLAPAFLDQLFRLIDRFEIDYSSYTIDHICFRTASVDEYQRLKESLSAVHELLIESPVGGWRIATYRLAQPIKYKEWSIPLLELPEPKAGSQYQSGFEHIEFVIEKSFEELSSQYSSLTFDYKGTHKRINPELRLKLDQNYCIKFHHLPLDKVIEIEKAEAGPKNS